MRKKQVQGRLPSDRPKRKCTAACGLETAGSNKGTFKSADPRSVAKRRKVKGTKAERTLDDEEPGACKETHGCSNGQLLMNRNGDGPFGERGFCHENTCRDPVESGDEDDHYGLEDGEEREIRIHLDSPIYLDDDSNQVLPVGQFFGNIELVQDFPARAPSSESMSRREYRRLHYVAKIDSDEDDDIREDDRCETQQPSDDHRSNTDSGGDVTDGNR
ncbi:hypothetical protein GJAV_G00187520 [Gymnothorax javanicus]|nr:hypothetical protein GJAV_G00187520 [Gymnothorax javanicus]